MTIALIKKNFIFIILILLVQTVAIDAIIVSYGININNQYQAASEEASKKKINIAFGVEDGDMPSVAALREAMPELLDGYTDILDSVAVDCFLPLNKVADLEYVENEIGSDYRGRKILKVTSLFSLTEDGYVFDKSRYNAVARSLRGQAYSSTDMNSGKPVCMTLGVIQARTGSVLRIAGQEYSIIGTYGDTIIGDILMPMESMCDDMELRLFAVYFNRLLSPAEFDTIVDRIKAVYPGRDCLVQDYVRLDADNVATRDTLSEITVFLATLAILTIYQIYRYKLERDKPALAIQYICGRSSAGMFLRYMLGVTTIMAASALLAYMIFDKALYAWFMKEYVWFELIFKDSSALTTGFKAAGLTLAALFFINISFFSTSPYRMWKKKIR